ncbi:hypothetical protein L1887_63307 [Cichorium endivia]|nr:hypothetical protein L1887_63307 [Cichorium endivia]
MMLHFPRSTGASPDRRLHQRQTSHQRITARYEPTNSWIISKMKIATLQLDSKIRNVQENIAKADTILRTNPPPSDLDLLVLPELAFTGYNYPSYDSIKPYLEPTTAGVTTQWAIATAKRLSCHIIAGYPEISTEIDDTAPPSTDTPIAHKRYNSTVTVSPTGEILANYRKSFLYYTDESWATEGPEGFYCGELGSLGKVIPLGDEVCYAGSSCAMRFSGSNVSILDMMGKAEEGLLALDTDKPAKYELRLKAVNPGDESGDDD